MVVPRRMWESSVVIGYLSGSPFAQPTCDLIIAQAERGELEIVVCTMAEAEVAFLRGLSPMDSESKIKEFFSRRYIVRCGVDVGIMPFVRQLLRTHSGLKPPDAIHIAICLQWHIPVLETFDNGMLALDRKEGSPPLIIRKPLYQGSQPFPGFKV